MVVGKGVEDVVLARIDLGFNLFEDTDKLD